MVVSHLNIRSILPKHGELQVFMESFTKASVFGLSESWLDEDVLDAELVVAGFTMYRKDRNRKGGGILVYISEDVRSFRRQDLEDEGIEAMWIEVRMRKRWVLICNLYRPPGAPMAWMDSLAAMVERAVEEKINVIMMGDFNCNMLCPDSKAVRLAMVMSEYGLVQMINGPTRVTESSETQIDLLFTTDQDLLDRVGCEEPALSDHSLIFGVLANECRQKEPHPTDGQVFSGL